MGEAYICDAVRTPIGRYGGALSSVRTDDLGAIPMTALAARNRKLDPAAIEDVAYGCANQAGEDNRNVARMSALLAGLPVTVPAATVNRLCGSGMNAIGNVADAIRAGSIGLAIAGGVESMSRAPFVMGKQTAAFGRNAEMYDTTLGWRFVNARLEDQYGIDSMAETAENVADDFSISRDDQDQFALRSQQRAEVAIASGIFTDEIAPVEVAQRKGDPLVIDTDEHPRAGSTIEGLAKLRPIVRKDGTITAGNASGINDGACALLIASEAAAAQQGLELLARVVAWAVTGVEPRIMGIGPAPASRKALEKAGLQLHDMGLVEVNEAFAPQYLAVQKELGLDPDKTNVHGGAIAIGHPLAASGTRITIHLLHALRRAGKRYGLGSACIGGGQGAAVVVEAF